jgi:hypothetical protein
MPRRYTDRYSFSSYHMSGKVQAVSTMRRRALESVRGAEIPLPVMNPLPPSTCPTLETDSLPLLHSDVPEATFGPDTIPGEFSYCFYGMNFNEDCFEIRSDTTGFTFDPWIRSKQPRKTLRKRLYFDCRHCSSIHICGDCGCDQKKMIHKADLSPKYMFWSVFVIPVAYYDNAFQFRYLDIQ